MPSVLGDLQSTNAPLRNKLYGSRSRSCSIPRILRRWIYFICHQHMALSSCISRPETVLGHRTKALVAERISGSCKHSSIVDLVTHLPSYLRPCQRLAKRFIRISSLLSILIVLKQCGDALAIVISSYGLGKQFRNIQHHQLLARSHSLRLNWISIRDDDIIDTLAFFHLF